MNKRLLSGVILSTLVVVILCACPNNCNGRGECNADSQCVCHKQQGLGLNDANFQLPLYTGADCSQSITFYYFFCLGTCPTGVSFASFDTGDTLFSKVEAAGEGDKTTTRMLFNDEEERELDSNSTTTTEVELGEETIRNATVIESNVIAPAFEKTTAKGGVMSCMVEYTSDDDGGSNTNGTRRMSLTVYGYQRKGTSTVYVTDLPYGTANISECYVTYVRRDLSLFGTIVFDANGTSTWPGIGAVMVNYGFASNTEYNIRVACVESAKTGIIRQLDNYVAMIIEDDSEEGEKAILDVAFNLLDENNPPAFCFMLSTGTENGRVMHIDMISSELSMMIGRDGSNYYYGQKIENGGVIQTVIKAEEIVAAPTPSDLPRILADPATIDPTHPDFPKVDIPDDTYRYYFDFSKIYGLDGKETSGKRDYSGFVRFLNEGSKATIIATQLGAATKLEVKQVQVKKNAVEVSCKDDGFKLNDTAYALQPQSNTGCFYLFFDTNVLDGKTGAYLLNVFVSPSGSVHPVIECSGNGLCNRQTGQCQCYAGYDGDACQRFSCPNDCSNHGRCVQVSDAISQSITAKDYPSAFGHYRNEKYSMFACICDKGHRGPDCSLLECPSHDDPQVKDPTAYKEKRDCSGRGVCNYQTGNCECFQGFYGTACETASQGQ